MVTCSSMISKQTGWVSVIKKNSSLQQISCNYELLKIIYDHYIIFTKNYYLRNSYCVGVGYTHRLFTLERRNGTRKKDQHVRDVVDLNGGLGDHLYVE